MKKIFFLLLLTIFLTPNIARATEAYNFISAIIDSFHITVIARNRIRDVDFEKIDPTSMITAITVFKKELKKAAQRVEPFTLSKNSDIKLFAEAYNLTYASLIINQEALLNLLEQTLNNPKTKGGTFSRNFAEISGEMAVLWREFPETTALLTNILVNTKGNGDKLTHLIITSQEKTLIMNDLVKIFGDEVKAGPKAGQESIEGAAALLYSFFDKSGFKPSDVK